MDELANKHKHREFDELLDRGVVMIHIDPRVDGVVVPRQFSGECALRLNVAYGFSLPALESSETGIYAVLSFGGQNFGCTIPWSAVYALTLPEDEHDGMVWPDSIPAELQEVAAPGAQKAPRLGKEPNQAPGKPTFSVLPGGGAADVAEPSEPRRGHLKLVKS